MFFDTHHVMSPGKHSLKGRKEQGFRKPRFWLATPASEERNLLLVMDRKVIIFLVFFELVFGRTDFSRISFLGRRIFFRGFGRRFFSSFFVGKVPRKILQRRFQAKSSKINITKIPDTFLQRGRENVFVKISRG